jgi:hypothetical protein
VTAHVAFDDGSIISFKERQAGVKQTALGYYDDVEPLRDFVTTKNLSNQSLGSIALNRATELACGRDAQPAVLTGRQHEHRAVTAVNLASAIVNLPKVGAPADSFGGAKTHRVLHARRPVELFAADRKPLAAFRASAFQHQSAVLRAHPHQKPMRPPTMTRVRLKCALALHGTSSE